MRNLIIDYSCSGPEEYMGRSLLSLQQDKNIVNCSYVIDDEDPRTGGDFDMKTPVTSSNAGLMVISMFGIALVIGGVTCMGKENLTAFQI